MRFSLLLILSLASAAAAGQRPYFGAPGVLYLDGVGPSYGAIGGVENPFASGGTLAAFASLGAVKGGGLGLMKLPVLEGRGALSAGLGILQEARFTTQYGRGYEQRLLVDQAVDGFGFGVKLDYERIPKRLNLDAAYSFSSIGFVDYRNRAGRTIPLDKKDLHPVETHLLTLGAAYDALENLPGILRLRAGFTAMMGRRAQSDVGVFRTGVGGTRRLAERFRLSYTAALANAVVIRDAGPGRADFQCSKIADPELRLDCERLETQLSAFVVKSNAVGTAPPLGGSKGLRSYREMRFKAANTALSGLEFGFSPLAKLEMIAFYELGHASDSFSALFSRSRHSAGVGLRTTLGEIPLRAEFAYGHEGGAAFLTAGAAW